MEPSEVLAAAHLAFTREKAAIETARSMVIGTAGKAPHSVLVPVLDSLARETARMEAAESALSKLLLELLLRRRGEWPVRTPEPTDAEIAEAAERAVQRAKLRSPGETG
jgi:hypothetical protein